MKSFQRFFGHSEFADLEQSLKTSFISIKPDPDFVSKLQNRIVRRPKIQLERDNLPQALFVIASGLFVGAISILLIAILGGKKG